MKSIKKNLGKMKTVKLNSIRTKLIISLVSICVIPLVISGFISYSQSKKILSNKLTVTSTQTLTEINYGLTDYFNGFSNMITMAGNNENFANFESGESSSEALEILKGVQTSDKDILSAYYGTTTHKFMSYPVEKVPDGYDPTARPWYKQAIENKGKVIVTPPYKDAITGNLVVTLAKAVENNGQTVGVVAMDCTLNTISEKISKKVVGNSGYVFISDLSGIIIAHPNKDIISTDEASKLSIWNQIKSEDTGFIQYEYNGTGKFGVFQTNGLTGWKLIASLEETELTTDTQAILKITFLIIAVITVISIVASLMLSKGIAQSIKQLRYVFNKASEGDLTVSISPTTKDEFKDLAESFNHMMKNISSLMNSVTKSSKEVLQTSSNLASMSEEVTASIGEVAKAIEEVSAGATNQAQSAQNGAEEMNELSNRLDKMTVSSSEVDELSTNTKQLGSEGLSMMDILIDKSNKTKEATTAVNVIVKDMNESTKKINTISDTISKITEQTNLLSLNASIESARAGEAGRGFAVVADEIRKLAEQSKSSTEEIKLIIASIQQKSDIAVSAIKSTEDVVNEQDLAVGETKEIFIEILKSIGTMINKVEDIKADINEIDGKKRKVAEEIEDISSISQETASASEEVTASTEEISSAMNNFTKYAEELQNLAKKLESEIQKFNI